MKELVVHLAFGKVLAFVSLVAIIMTGIMYYLSKNQKKYRLIKYVPGLIFILIGVINLIRLGIKIPGVDEFDSVLSIVMALVGGFVALFSALIIGIITKKEKKMN